MSTGIDIKFVQETYQRMSDDELIRIATQDASGLPPEAMEVVKTEIQKRGLDQNITKGLEAQNKTYTIKEVDAYCDIVRNLSCPTCGNTTERLNVTMTGEVISVLFFTSYVKRTKIGCPPCLDKAHNSALLKSALLGWWGIPWGIIRTLQAIVFNLRRKQTNHLQDHNEDLRSFALNVIGELEAYKENKEKLQQILARQNRL
jgi:hypothetical protein